MPDDALDPLRLSGPVIEDLLENAADAYAVYDSEFRALYLNAAAARLAGKPKPEILGSTPWEGFPALAGGEFERQCRRAMAERLSTSFEYYYPPFAKWAEIRISPTTSGSFFASARDVTARKMAEEGLRDSQAELKEAQRLAGMGSWAWDPETGVVTWSDGLYRLDGLDPTLLAPTFQELRHVFTPESWERVEPAVEKALRDGTPYEIDVEVALRDGRRAWRTIRGEAVRDAGGRITKLRGAVLDITARVRAERQMSNLATAIEQAAETVVVTDLDGAIQYCNPAFEKITGYSRDEAAGLNPNVLKSGKHSAEFYADLWNTIKNGRVWSGRFTNKKKDGSLYEEDATISPIYDASGTMTGFVAVKRDVTERVNLEGQLRQAQKLEGLGRLAGGVAHDFNNLLTVINGYSGMLLHELPKDDHRRDWAAEIRKAGERAAGLANQLLAFSRNQVVEPRPTDLRALVAENRELLQRLIGEDIELATKLDAATGTVLADPGLLHQVLMNLAANARDAMPRGGRLAIRTTNFELDGNRAAEWPGVAPGPYVRLEVEDTGVGIGEGAEDRIFDPFFTTKGESGGTGLGLSTVYGIVRQCSGSIAVHSEPGRGATFDILLPRTEEPAAESGQAAPPNRAARGSETVLVVEDQDPVRGLAVRILKSYGYRVLEAAQGGAALLLAERYPHPIHLMLSDMVMPHMTGRELASRLRPLRPEMKVLFMSGYDAEAIAGRGLLEHGEAYLAKPFAPEELAAKVREVLGPARPPATILVVDDDESVRRFFRQILAEAGYQVFLACDGAEALAVARHCGIDLVVTDLVMPGREGIETIQALRSEQPGMKIVAVSGAFGGTFLDVARGLGANATLKKPVSSSDLAATVRNVLLTPPAAAE